MAGTVDQAILTFLKRHVDADKQAIEQALESQKVLRERLQAKCEEDPSLPAPYGDGFLYGSLMRGTKNHPMDDVDYMFLLDGTGLVATRAGTTVGPAAGANLRVNPANLPKYHDEYGKVSSIKIMAALREVLAESYPRSVVRKDGQAINVWLDKYGFGIDVVPSFFIMAQNGQPPHYYIPHGNGDNGWMSTNPKTDLGAYDDADARFGSLLRPVARLVKTWNKVVNVDRLKSFHLDLLVLRALSHGTSADSLSAMIVTFFVNAHSLLANTCPQLTGFEPLVDGYLSPDDRRLSLEAVDSAASVATRALQFEAAGHIDEALALWAVLFGEEVLAKSPANL